MQIKNLINIQKSRILVRSIIFLIIVLIAVEASAQQPPWDEKRARELYVSKDPKDHPVRDYERDIQRKARTDSIYYAKCEGVIDFKKITYRSNIGDMWIPAYLFQPLEKRGDRGHAALIWLHGGVHGNFGTSNFPYIKEAIDRGYIVIAPEYRGSTGYGKEHHEAIDYGGYEVDDCITAADYMLVNLPHVDSDRIGMIGWSHGGMITANSVFRDHHPLKCGVAIVPVTNYVFRLAYKGPRYQRQHSTQKRVQGLPHEKREIYIERSPLYKVHKLQVPLMAFVATNDEDVNFVECEMLINALKVKKPNLSETKIYVDPPGGHGFSKRLNRETLERTDTKESRDAWNRIWTFLEWNLEPYREK